MKFHGDASLERSDPEGYFTLMVMVFASGAPIDSISLYAARRALVTPLGGFVMRSYVAFTSAEVICVPSWNFTLVRSLIVHVSLSAESCGSSAATSGMILVRSLGSKR